MNLESELNLHLKKFKTPKRSEAFAGKHYIGSGRSKLLYLDLVTADVRSVLKKELSFKGLTLAEQFDAIEEVWFSSQVFEVKSICLYWVGSQKDETLIKFSNRLIKWSSEIDNWALSDGLCSIYARIFEQAPSKLLPTFKKWNASSNPWLARISLVSLFYYARLRKNYPSFNLAIGFIKTQLKSSDYYVQKAVGWTLRELYQVYPQKTIQFVTKNIQNISPSAWYATSEKMMPAEKSKLLKLRKKLRTKK